MAADVRVRHSVTEATPLVVHTEPTYGGTQPPSAPSDGRDDDFEDKALPEGPTVTRTEEWAYYLYYNGDNGVGPNGYAPVLFQALASGAAVDRSTRVPCDSRSDPGSSLSALSGSSDCVLRFLGADRRVSSVVLLADGASFLLMTLLFTTLGPAADYGPASSRILLAATLICWTAQLGFLLDPGWRAAMALYVGGMVSYGVTLVFYASVFPRLARSTPATKAAWRRAAAASASDSTSGADGTAAEAAAAEVEALERARLSSHSTAHSNWGYLIVLLLSLCVLLPATGRGVETHVLALTVAYWAVLALPWFLLQRPRPGPPLPAGARWATVGWRQLRAACRQRRRLPVTFAYLAAFFLLADGVNTTGSLVRVLQARQTRFSFTAITLLNLAQAACSILSCYGCFYLQQRRRLPSKRVLLATSAVSVLIPAWGLLGLRKGSRIGFKRDWEFWAYNVAFGLGQAPYYAYAQAVMADLTPPGQEGLWFGLFGLTNRASSLVGPNVCALIIDWTGDEWAPFAFLTPVCLAAALGIALGVDVPRGRRDAVAFARRRARPGPSEAEGP